MLAVRGKTRQQCCTLRRCALSKTSQQFRNMHASAMLPLQCVLVLPEPSGRAPSTFGPYIGHGMPTDWPRDKNVKSGLSYVRSVCCAHKTHAYQYHRATDRLLHSPCIVIWQFSALCSPHSPAKSERIGADNGQKKKRSIWFDLICCRPDFLLQWTVAWWQMWRKRSRARWVLSRVIGNK